MRLDADRVVVELAANQDGDDAASCVHAVFDALRKCDTGKAVVDLRAFSTMSPEAQDTWRATVGDLSGWLKDLTVVGGTPLARTAITAMCLRAGISVRQASSL